MPLPNPLFPLISAALAAAAIGTAHAQDAPPDLRGAWSGEARCARASMRHVFGARTYEWRTVAKRLYFGEASYKVEGDRILVSLVRDIEAPARDEGGPQAGDVIAYRRQGAALKPLSLTRGKATNQYPPSAPLFRRCAT
jgi:hypothetical protein